MMKIQSRPTRRQLIQLSLIFAPLSTVAQVSPATGKSKATLTAPMVVLRSTRLSVLSDRITRCQAQILLGVLVARSEKVLIESLTESISILADLKQVSLSAITRGLLAQADREFQILIQAIENFRNQDVTGLLALSELADKAGLAVDQFTEVFIKENASRNLVILQTTADLLRLTQHNAVHFLLARAGLAELEQAKVLDKGLADFDRLLAELRRSPLVNEKIQNAKQLLDNQWVFMRKALESKAKDPGSLQTVATTSERTFEVLMELYAQFDAMARANSGR